MSAARLADRIRELALSLPSTYEDEPWGHPVFKVGENPEALLVPPSGTQVEPASRKRPDDTPKKKRSGRMFASMIEDGAVIHLTVKLTAEERQLAEMLPYVRKARYVGRYGWVTADVEDEESLEAALEWLRESYWLRAPAELRWAVEEPGK